MWLLGSSPQSALWAADSGLPYVFADFINPDGTAYAATYHERFCPSELLATPRMVVAAWAICADTDEEAQRIASSARMTRALLNRGQLIPVPPIEKALRFLDGLASGEGFGADHPAGLVLEEGAHAAAHDFVIIGDQNAQ